MPSRRATPKASSRKSSKPSNKLSSKSKTWWGKQFLTALESFTDSGRLSRGRSYSSDYRLRQFEIDSDGLVFARVLGNANPYYGVYDAPTYTTTIEFPAISRSYWNAVIALITTNAGLISKLMMNEIPISIEESFETLGLNLLPQGEADCIAHCSCPDSSNPCKHIAGVYYRVAQEIDRDPFLLFELRGLPRKALQEELAKSPLGMALSQEMNEKESMASPVPSRFAQPVLVHPPKPLTLRDYWLGKRRLPDKIEPASPAIVPAILIKKQGDYPLFWHRENSFIETMESLYQRVRSQNKDLLE